MLEEPEAPTFPHLAKLADAPSAEYNAVCVPPALPTVSDILMLPVMPCAVLLRIDVSDSHEVASEQDLPRCNDDVYAANPISIPVNVRLAEPDEARLVCLPRLRKGVSAESDVLTLPAKSPVVTDIRRLNCSLCTIWHATLVSESQELPSQAVYPTKNAAVCFAGPMLAPMSVKLAVPVAARF